MSLIDEMEYHACLTGDCDHAKQKECDACIDEFAVMIFANALRKRLTYARKKGHRGWTNKLEHPTKELHQLLEGHTVDGAPLDVGVVAMMLYLRGEKTSGI